MAVCVDKHQIAAEIYFWLLYNPLATHTYSATADYISTNINIGKQPPITPVQPYLTYLTAKSNAEFLVGYSRKRNNLVSAVIGISIKRHISTALP